MKSRYSLFVYLVTRGVLLRLVEVGERSCWNAITGPTVTCHVRRLFGRDLHASRRWGGAHEECLCVIVSERAGGRVSDG